MVAKKKKKKVTLFVIYFFSKLKSWFVEETNANNSHKKRENVTRGKRIVVALSVEKNTLKLYIVENC